MDASDIVERIADIFERRGAEEYLGEPVTVAQHMLQCASLAVASGAPDMLVAAALLHDIGHFTSEFGSYSSDDTDDRHHDDAGADFLSGYFPPAVAETVRLHVAAKRYLCAIEPEYRDRLSTASKHSLQLQGGPMSAAECEAFRQSPFHAQAVSVRRWDDGGKVVGIRTMTLAEFRPLLQRVACSR